MDSRQRLGLVLDRPEFKAQIGSIVQGQSFELAGVYNAASDRAPNCEADAWLVLLADEMHNVVLENWLEHQDAPVIFDEISGTPDSDFARRLEKKLHQLAGMISLAVKPHKLPLVSELRAVWVLAASTGGPAAVKAFLQALPTGLGIAFIYAQHIDEGFDLTLAQMISRGSRYGALLAGHGSLVLPDNVIIVRPDQQTEVLVNNTLVLHQCPWAGAYSPAINQVMVNVASVYGSRSGAIIFSGMGDDGRAACKMMKQQGGEIWIQTPDSCTVSSMPDEAESTGVVSFSGTPEQLAVALSERYL